MRDYPIVVDLDGTLTPVDTLYESLVRLIKKNPVIILSIILWALNGKAYLKQKVADLEPFVATKLPLNDELLNYLKEQKEMQNRSLILATASHENTANAVAQRLQIFDDVIASTSDKNLKGAHKLEVIQQKYKDGFVYAGDSNADLPIWKEAKAAIPVNVSPITRKKLLEHTVIEKEFSTQSGLKKTITWLKAMRVYQWLKNTLLFVPILTTFSFSNVMGVTHTCMAFLSFSLLASATYILNDVMDIDSDRAHPRKSKRPFASGELPILSGLIFSAVLLIAGVVLSLFVSSGFTTVLLIYLCITVAYSFALKSIVLIDVIILSLLYTSRIIAGGVAIGEPISSWLLAFSVFIFLSLALIKRCAELVSLQKENKIEILGRAYTTNDLVVLWPLGIGAAMSSVVVFGLFISAPETVGRYASPHILWLCAVILTYWLSRLWIITARGQMHDDPIIFAIKDRTSRYTIATIVLVAIIAHYYQIGI